MAGCVPETLSEEDLQDLLLQAKDYVISHGVLYRLRENPECADIVTYAPFTLYPSMIPRECFERATSVMTDFNLLMHRVAHDYDFLKMALENTIQVDDFTRHMWDIYETIRKEGIAQPISLGLHRSDYMIDWSGDTCAASGAVQPRLRQVEFNTVASSFGGLCQRLCAYHRYILGISGMADKRLQVPDNKTGDGFGGALAMAWEHYGNPDAVILCFINEKESNIYDQRCVEYAIRENSPHIKVIRRTIKEMRPATLSEDKRLSIDGMEIGVVYFRTGYSPTDFKEEKDWNVRLQIERSRAIRCPNIYYHLAGTKKVQQVLAEPGMVERFIPDTEAAQRIRDTFAGLYSLDMTENGNKAVAMAMENPERYVLKPQREGGGNNTYGEEIRNVLSKIGDSSERTAYILMERIFPRASENYPVKSGSAVQRCKMINELGIFGLFLGTKDKVIMNKQQGHILRTKVEGMDEGGVSVGYSCLDSPFLV